MIIYDIEGMGRVTDELRQMESPSAVVDENLRKVAEQYGSYLNGDHLARLNNLTTVSQLIQQTIHYLLLIFEQAAFSYREAEKNTAACLSEIGTEFADLFNRSYTPVQISGDYTYLNASKYVALLMQSDAVPAKPVIAQLQDTAEFTAKVGGGVILFEQINDAEFLTELERKKELLKIISVPDNASLEGVFEIVPMKGDYFVTESEQLYSDYLNGAFINRPYAKELFSDTYAAAKPDSYKPIEKNEYSLVNYKSVSLKKIAYFSTIALSISIAVCGCFINNKKLTGVVTSNKNITISRKNEAENEEFTDILHESVSSDVFTISYLGDSVQKDDFSYNEHINISINAKGEMERDGLTDMLHNVISAGSLGVLVNNDFIQIDNPIIYKVSTSADSDQRNEKSPNPEGLVVTGKNIAISTKNKTEHDEQTDMLYKSIFISTLIPLISTDFIQIDNAVVHRMSTAAGRYIGNDQNLTGLMSSGSNLTIDNKNETEPDELTYMLYNGIFFDIPALPVNNDFIQTDNLNVLFSSASLEEMGLPDLKNISDILIAFDSGEKEIPLREFMITAQVSLFDSEEREEEEYLVSGQISSHDLLDVLFMEHQEVPVFQVVYVDSVHDMEAFDIRVIISDTGYQNIEGVVFQENHQETLSVDYNEKAEISSFGTVKEETDYSNPLKTVDKVVLLPFSIVSNDTEGMWKNMIHLYNKINKSAKTDHSADEIAGVFISGGVLSAEQENEFLRNVSSFLVRYLNAGGLEDTAAEKRKEPAAPIVVNTGEQPEEEELTSITVTKDNSTYLSENPQAVDAILGIINSKESLTDISDLQNTEKAENVFTDEEKIALAEIFTGAAAVKVEEAQSAAEVKMYTHTNTTDKFNDPGIDDTGSHTEAAGKSTAGAEPEDIEDSNNEKADPYVNWSGDTDEIDYEIPEITGINSSTVSEKDIIEISWKLLGSLAMGTAAAFGIYLAAKAIQGGNSVYNLDLQEKFEEFKMNTAKHMPENANKLSDGINMLTGSTTLASFILACLYAGTSPSSASLVITNSAIFAVMYILKELGKETKT